MAGSAGNVLFEDRFLDKHAGSIITDTAVAIVELVANSWDAYATKVEITWPEASSGTTFQITDNGKGLTQEMFEHRWRKLDYDRIAAEGSLVEPPPDLVGYGPRRVYGRNGRGRHGAFRFSDPYLVRTWRDGSEVTFEVRRGTSSPFDVRVLSTREGVEGHGTTISATSISNITTDADTARQIIGTRFLADPNFRVSVDGSLVTFDDLPASRLHELDVDVLGHGKAHLTFVDSEKTDRSTRQHGIAWWVNMRLVGSPSWTAFDHSRLLDGRTKEARRFQVIVQADFLEDAVMPDWTTFNPNSGVWNKTQEAVHAAIHDYLSNFTAGKRTDTKASVHSRLEATVRRMPPAGRERWNQFVDKVVDTCPSLNATEVEQIATILANLELLPVLRTPS